MGFERFEHRVTEGGVVRVRWEGRLVAEIGGVRGRRLAAALDGADDERTQDLLRRATGNFRRGNERRGGRR